MTTTFSGDCPRCKLRHTTFDVLGSSLIERVASEFANFEAYCRCRDCKNGSIFLLECCSREAISVAIAKGIWSFDGSINDHFVSYGFVNIADMGAKPAPSYLPAKLEGIFHEATKCLAIGCYNAAGAMFRSCLDYATKQKMPSIEDEKTTKSLQFSLGKRLTWMFENGVLPISLEELASCVKNDGNDGVHDASLTIDDAEDLFDFTYALLENMYTVPEKLKLARERRDQRRSQS